MKVSTVPPIGHLLSKKESSSQVNVIRENSALLHNDDKIGTADTCRIWLPNNVSLSNLYTAILNGPSPLNDSLVFLGRLPTRRISMYKLNRNVIEKTAFAQSFKQPCSIMKQSMLKNYYLFHSYFKSLVKLGFITDRSRPRSENLNTPFLIERS